MCQLYILAVMDDFEAFLVGIYTTKVQLTVKIIQ